MQTDFSLENAAAGQGQMVPDSFSALRRRKGSQAGAQALWSDIRERGKCG